MLRRDAIPLPIFAHEKAVDKGFKYAGRYAQMRRDHGTLWASASLVESGEVQSGFIWCIENDLKDYTVEALIVTFAHEFHPEHVKAAQFRLDHALEL